MNWDSLLLVGAGGHALSAIDVIESAGWAIAGLIGGPDEASSQVLGYDVIGSDDALAALHGYCSRSIVTIGQIESPDRRIAAFHRLMELGFDCPAVIAPDAEVSRHAEIGPGTIVMHGAIVNAGAKVGANCIVNSRALIEHGARVGDHCHVSTGSILNGDVRLGDGSFVGSGAVVKQGLSLGRRVVVGMGLSVRHDLVDGTRHTRHGNS